MASFVHNNSGNINGQPAVSGTLKTLDEQDFLGIEGRELLAALDDQEADAEGSSRIASKLLSELRLDDFRVYRTSKKTQIKRERFSGRETLGKRTRSDIRILNDEDKNSSEGEEVQDLRPYLMPLGENLETKLRNWSERQRQKDIHDFVLPPISPLRIRRDGKGDRRVQSAGLLSFAGEASKSASTSRRVLQPETARKYLWETIATAKERHLMSVTEAEQDRRKAELDSEEAELAGLQEQIRLHEEAFDAFLADNYRKVSATIQRSAEVQDQKKEQEARLEYFSGLLQESQTQLEEEKERLEEVTAYQHFLAASMPHQTLQDLQAALARLHEKEVIATTISDAPPQPKPVQSISSTGKAASQNYLEEEIRSMRLLDAEFPPHSVAVHAQSAEFHIKQGFIAEGNVANHSMEIEANMPAAKVSKPKEASTVAELGLQSEEIDTYLNDTAFLLQLAELYENQCHTLLGLLTRLEEERESVEVSIRQLQDRSATQLAELQRLEVASQHSEHQHQLHTVRQLHQLWPQLAQDDRSQKMLQQLLQQISILVRDVFGHSRHMPLLPDTSLESGKIQGPEVGDIALLSLLEARFTDLCIRLDATDQALREQIFLDCERERRQRLVEEKKKKSEDQRNERRKAHLDRALLLPPPRTF